jgi:hypothetical protein
MTRRLLLLAPVFALALAVLAVRGADTSKPAKDTDEGKLPLKETVEELAARQERLARQFKEFKEALLRLAQRMEKSSKLEDREKAVVLRKAIDLTTNEGVDTKFDKLIAFLKANKAIGIGDLDNAMAQNKDLAGDIRTIINILLTDNRDEELRKERERVQELLKKLNEIIRAQQTVRAWTERGTMDKDRLGGEQKQVSGATKDLAKSLGKGDQGKEGAAKGDIKGEGSKKGEGAKAGQGKEDTGQQKAGGKEKDGSSGKDGEKSGGKEGGKEGEKSGSGKEGDKDGEKSGGKEGGKEGEKSGSGKEGGKDGEKAGGKEGGKDGEKSAGGKEGGKDGEKSGSGKEGGKDGEKSGGGKEGGKEGEKAGGNKDGGKQGGKEGGKEGGKAGEQANAKSGGKDSEGGKGGEKGGKPGEGQQSGGKSGGKEGDKGGEKGDQKPGDSKGKESGKGDAKPPEKGGQQQAGGQQGGQQGGQKGESKSGGQQGGQQQAGGGKSGGQGGGQQGDQGQQQQKPQDPKDSLPGRKQIEDAHADQQGAEKKIEEEKNKDAGKKQDEAIDKLKAAQKKLEDLLRQLREEEIERLLAALQARCERMLAMQIEVRDGTVRVYKAIDANADKKASRTEDQQSLQLGEKEEEIVREANKAIQLLEAEGSAVAFPEVFTQVRTDMINVARRLRKTDVALVTQTIENDIIDTLKEMIEALKKAQQQQKAKQQQGQPQQGGSAKNNEDKLIDKIAELKMIRSMQLRLNARTKTYAQEYPNLEQVPAIDPKLPAAEREKLEMLQKESKNLSERQLKIWDVTNNIYKGKNQ